MLKYQGLSDNEVFKRITHHQINTKINSTTKSYRQIFQHHFFTLFNLINFILMIFILTTRSFKNMMFTGVVISNLIIGIFQEIRAKRILDKLSLLNESVINIIRNGHIQTKSIYDIVIDDLIILEAGKVIPCDCMIIEGGIEVNESSLTGESDIIYKTIHEQVYSGSYVISGKVIAKVIHVGKDNYIETIHQEAKRFQKHPSQLRDAIDFVIRSCAVLLTPLAITLFIKQYCFLQASYHDSVLSTSAAVIGMIPEGLVLLSSIALAVGSINLAKHHTLVQELYCIETLARVDTLCLDKTGTLTQGHMKVHDIISDKPLASIQQILASMLHVLPDNNATALALRDYVKDVSVTLSFNDILPFQSERKYSAVYGDESYYLGASSAVLEVTAAQQEKLQSNMRKGYRVLVLAKGNDTKDHIRIEAHQLLAIILFHDPLREDAKDILQYFKQQGVALKLISGDDHETVLNCAKQAELADSLQGIDCSHLSDEKLISACDTTQIFGRVRTRQKQLIIQTLKQQGHIVAMLGDGVNDVMAFKEAHCSIAMGSGSDIAKKIANLVLLNDDFASIPYIVNEGRRVINNIQRSASLFLVKTIFSFMLTILTLCFIIDYPFEPIQLTLISSCTIGIPGFILALQPNQERVQGSFIKNVLMKAFPTSLCIVIAILFTASYVHFMKCPIVFSTMSFYLTSIISFYGLAYISFPFNSLRVIMYISLLSIYLIAVCFFPTIFNIVTLSVDQWLIILGISFIIFLLYLFLLKSIKHEKR